MASVIPVMSYSRANTSFGNSSKVNSSYLTPQKGNDTVVINKNIPKTGGFFRKISKFLLLGTMLGAGAILTDCQPPISTTPSQETPTPRPTPVKTAADGTQEAIASVFEPLNPLKTVDNSPVPVRALTDFSTNSIKGFNYQLDGNTEAYTVTSMNPETGILTATHTTPAVAAAKGTSEDYVTLVKNGEGFVLTHADGTKEQFEAAATEVQNTNFKANGDISSVSKLQQVAGSQGEVVLKDANGVTKGNWSKFTLVVTEAGTKLLSSLKK